MLYVTKVSSEGNPTEVLKQLNILVVTFVTHCHGSVRGPRAVVCPSGF